MNGDDDDAVRLGGDPAEWADIAYPPGCAPAPRTPWGRIILGLLGAAAALAAVWWTA